MNKFLYIFFVTPIIANVIQIGGGFEIESTESCDIKVTHNNVVIFESDDHFIQLANGVFDQYQILIDGELNQLPQPDSYQSINMVNCSQTYINQDYAQIEGQLLTNATGTEIQQLTLQFFITFSTVQAGLLKYNINVPNAINNNLNMIELQFKSDQDEEIYGMGLQKIWNLKGKKVPLVATTGAVNSNQYLLSSAPAASFITTKQRGFICTTTQFGLVEFKQDSIVNQYWYSESFEGFILSGEDPLSLAQLASIAIGPMISLPKWISQGIIIGITGGQQNVQRVYDSLKQKNVQMIGVFVSDWSGSYEFEEGQRSLWTWQLNPQQFSGWNQVVNQWALDGVKPVVSVCPYLADLSAYNITNEIFDEAILNNYFVRNSENEVYMMTSESVQFGMIDFTNDMARNWVKRLIRTKLIQEAQVGGWIHDQGQNLPFDAVMYDQSLPVEYHTRYIEDWAELAKETLMEIGSAISQNVFYTMRTGTTRTAQFQNFFQVTDQQNNYSFQGMKNTLIAQLNSGLSGFTLSHSEISGFSSVEENSSEQSLIHRWIEMSAFADVIMRTRPSNDIDARQIWQDDFTIQQLNKFVSIHVALSEYKAYLISEAQFYGTPMTRPLLLHFSSDQIARNTFDQFMLGENILMAPVFTSSNKRDVYLPGPTKWTSIWDGVEYDVDLKGLILNDMDCPVGQPPVFYRDTSNYKISTVLKTFQFQVESPNDEL